MDSQENALEQGKAQEEKSETNVSAKNEATATEPAADAAVVVQVPESPVGDDNDNGESGQPLEEKETEPTEELPDKEQEKEVPAPKEYTSKKEILERVREIAHGDEAPNKEEVDRLKTLFYKLHTAERESQLSAYVAEGGDPEKYRIPTDDVEEAFKAEMQIIKEKRARLFLQQEEEKQANYKRKLEIIDLIKSMSNSPQEANQSYQNFKTLQAEWKEIGAVPAERSTELWRNYQLYVEHFYDQLKLNSEAREYDFKKNLHIKTGICEAAEKLADEPDVISAFYQLQELHQQYRETGPVAENLREEIWSRFKAASTVINKRHQQHFEQLRAKEGENLEKKTALCERAEAIVAEPINSPSEWEKRTKEIIALQQEWKQIGFAPQKMNVKIFDRFRSINDDFFHRKAEFFHNFKGSLTANAEKKRALVAKAKELSESKDWAKTSDALIKLQKEWKEVGPVLKKVGEPLWAEFQQACNHFFDARKAARGDVHSTEHANLDKKREIVKQLKEVVENPGDQPQEAVQKLIDEYNAVGHVPYKEKDKVYQEYHAVLDKIYNELHISTNKRNLDNFVQNLKQVAGKGNDALSDERGRLLRRYETLRQEITTYENNLGFLTTTSKNGSSLLDEMNRKVQKLKDDLELVRQKIKAIDKSGLTQP